MRLIQATCLLLGLLMAVARCASAQESIGILMSAPSAANDEFLTEFKKELSDTPGSATLRVSVIKDLAQEKPDLLLAVGVQALNQAAGAAQPVLGVLIPQVSYEKIRAEHARKGVSGKFSAIYLDQPLPRQFGLIRAILPKAGSIGVLLGPAAQQQGTALSEAANRFNFNLQLEHVGSEQGLMSGLRRVLNDSGVLLALPDPLVYNRETAQTILLTSYRHEKPVIGFSQAYVKAGALAGVFSTPAQIARQAAEIVREATATQKITLPEPQHPRYFSVDINRQVARSLGINVEEESAIHEKLLKIERASP